MGTPANYILINSVLVGTNQLVAGAQIALATDDLNAIADAGGILVAVPNATVEAAGVIARKLRLEGKPLEECDAVMLAAAATA